MKTGVWFVAITAILLLGCTSRPPAQYGVSPPEVISRVEPAIVSLEPIQNQSEYSPATLTSPSPSPSVLPTKILNASIDAKELERHIFDLINLERKRHDLPALEWNDEIAEVARKHSKDMVKRGFFGHKNLDGKFAYNRLHDAGINYYGYSGENLAMIPRGNNTAEEYPKEFSEGWMHSYGHRQNVLFKRFTETGVGVAVDGNETYYATQVFIEKEECGYEGGPVCTTDYYARCDPYLVRSGSKCVKQANQNAVFNESGFFLTNDTGYLMEYYVNNETSFHTRFLLPPETFSYYKILPDDYEFADNAKISYSSNSTLDVEVVRDYVEVVKYRTGTGANFELSSHGSNESFAVKDVRQHHLIVFNEKREAADVVLDVEYYWKS